jgi:hypothetical protein
LSPETREFFGNIDPLFRTYRKQVAVSLMASLRGDRAVDRSYRSYSRRIYQTASFLKTSGTYTWYARGNLGKGDFDLFRSFVERDFRALRRGGRLAQVLKDSVYLNANCSEIRRQLLTAGHIARLFVNENRKGVFAIDSRIKIVLMTAEKGTASDWVGAAFFVGKNPDLSERSLSTAELEIVLARPDEATTFIPRSLVQALAPETFAILEVRDRADIALLEHLVRNGIPFAAAWDPQYCRELDMTNDSHYFLERTGLEAIGATFDGMRWHHPSKGEFWPVVEGKNIYQLEFPVGDIRYWVAASHASDLPSNGGRRVNAYPRLAWRNVARSVDERSVIATRVPPQTFLGNSLQSIAGGALPDSTLAHVEGLFNTFLFDWQVRMRGATNLTHPIIGGIIVPCPLSRLAMISSEDRVTVDCAALGSLTIPFDLAEHIMAGFPLLDRLMPALRDEPRSTVTRDLVLAAYADHLKHPKSHYYRDRADRAVAVGARPYVPATRDESDIADDALDADEPAADSFADALIAGA